MRQSPVFQVRDDLLHQGMVPVTGLGLNQRHRIVGEHSMVAIARQQLILVARVQALHAAHDQTGCDLIRYR